jgi:hypothetical protein
MPRLLIQVCVVGMLGQPVPWHSEYSGSSAAVSGDGGCAPPRKSPAALPCGGVQRGGVAAETAVAAAARSTLRVRAIVDAAVV